MSIICTSKMVLIKLQITKSRNYDFILLWNISIYLTKKGRETLKKSIILKVNEVGGIERPSQHTERGISSEKDRTGDKQGRREGGMAKRCRVD